MAPFTSSPKYLPRVCLWLQGIKQKSLLKGRSHPGHLVGVKEHLSKEERREWQDVPQIVLHLP